MNNSEELKLLIMFSLLTAINLMVLSFILLFKKNNTLTNKVLGMLVFIPSIVLMVNPLLYSNYFSNYLLFVFLGFSITFLFGPLLLLYIHLVLGDTYQFKRKQLLHFFPLCMVAIYGIQINFQSDEYIEQIYLKIVSGEDLVTNLIYLAQFIHFSVYIILSIRKVNLFKTKTYMSIIDKTNYKWLRFFITRLLYLNILLLVVYVVQMSFFPSYMMYSDLLATPLASSCFYPIMVYKSFSNRVPSQESFEKKGMKSKRIQVSESASVINGEEYNEHIEELNSNKILVFLEVHKTFLNKDYTIFDLSKDLGYSQALVSSVINREMNMSFSKLINQFRIEESFQLLKEKSQELTIEAISELAGFKSRASFYRAFKQVTGSTPSQYIS